MKKIIVLFFVFFSLSMRAHAGLIFNEVMYDLPGSDDGREWIEVANTGADSVDMTGWKLFENNTNHTLVVSQGSAAIPVGGFSIIADTPAKFLLDWPGFSGTIFDSAFSLSNAGEPLALKDNHGDTVDTIAYDVSRGAGGDGNTLQLISAGWSSKTASPGIINEALLQEQNSPPIDPLSPPPNQDTDTPSDDQENPAPPLPPEPPQENGTDAQVIINEIMYDAQGSDDKHEWIEIENLGPSPVDLLGWNLYENDADHHLALVQGERVIGPAAFAVIADDAAAFLADHAGFSGTLFDSTFSLSNTGESIAFKDGTAVIRDQATYDAALGADGDGNTLQHFDAGFIAAPPTPGAMNALPPPVPPEDDDSQSDPPPLAPISIDEIAWMGTVSNQYGEWLELFNDSEDTVDLSGWKLSKDGGETLVYTLTKTIAPKGFLVIERTTDTSLDPLPEIDDESGAFGGGSFANLPAGEFLVLKDSFGRTVQSIDFSSGWPAGNNDTKETMQFQGGAWVTAPPTPDAINVAASPVSGNASSFASDAAPALIETIAVADEPIMHAKELPDRTLLMLSLVKRDDYFYIMIKNPTETPVSLSAVAIADGERNFILPRGTGIAAAAEIVIENTNTRFADADRVSWSDNAILIN